MRPRPTKATPTRLFAFGHLARSSSSLNLLHSQSLSSHGDEPDAEDDDEPLDDIIKIFGCEFAVKSWPKKCAQSVGSLICEVSNLMDKVEYLSSAMQNAQ